MIRPAGVTAIAILFFLVAAYLFTIGGVMLLWPGAVSMAAGAFLISELALAGPYMFLLISAVAAVVGRGFLRKKNRARRLGLAATFSGFLQ